MNQLVKEALSAYDDQNRQVETDIAVWYGVTETNPALYEKIVGGAK